MIWKNKSIMNKWYNKWSKIIKKYRMTYSKQIKKNVSKIINQFKEFYKVNIQKEILNFKNEQSMAEDN